MARSRPQIKVTIAVEDALNDVMRELRKVSELEPLKGERVLERGPMLGYLCRWFIEQPAKTRKDIIVRGKMLTMADGGESADDNDTDDAMPTTVITDIVAPPKQRKGGPKPSK